MTDNSSILSQKIGHLPLKYAGSAIHTVEFWVFPESPLFPSLYLIIVNN